MVLQSNPKTVSYLMENSNYCTFAQHLPKDNLHRIYHDTEYGFNCSSDNQLFEKLVLEIQQAGLSWSVVLSKREFIRKAYSNFDISIVSKYNEHEVKLMMKNKNIIRNFLKINATIYNAKQIIKIRKEYSSFKKWLDNHLHFNINEWTELFKKTFKFTGPKITKEFLMSSGYLAGAHNKNCKVYSLMLKKKPPWLINLKLKS